MSSSFQTTHAVTDLNSPNAQRALADSVRAKYYAQRKVERAEQQFDVTVQRAHELLTADEFATFADLVDSLNESNMTSDAVAAVALHALLSKRPDFTSKEPAAAPVKKNVAEYSRWLTVDEKELLGRYLPEAPRRDSVKPAMVINWLLWRQNKDVPLRAIPEEHYQKVDAAWRRWAKTGVWRRLSDELRDETSELYQRLDTVRLEELRRLCKEGVRLGGKAGDRAAAKQRSAHAHDAARRQSV